MNEINEKQAWSRPSTGAFVISVITLNYSLQLTLFNWCNIQIRPLNTREAETTSDTLSWIFNNCRSSCIASTPAEVSGTFPENEEYWFPSVSSAEGATDQ